MANLMRTQWLDMHQHKTAIYMRTGQDVSLYKGSNGPRNESTVA